MLTLLAILLGPIFCSSMTTEMIRFNTSCSTLHHLAGRWRWWSLGTDCWKGLNSCTCECSRQSLCWAHLHLAHNLDIEEQQEMLHASMSSLEDVTYTLRALKGAGVRVPRVSELHPAV